MYHDVDPPEGIAPRIVADALTELEEPEKSLAAPACELLVSMVKACPSTSYLAIYALLDQMLTMFKDPDVISIRAPILGHIATILKAMRDVYNPPTAEEAPTAQRQEGVTGFKFAAPSSTTQAQPPTQKDDGSAPNGPLSEQRTYDGDRRPLDGMRDELLATLSNGIRSSAYRSSALLAFVHLTHIPTFLDAAETNYMAENVNDLILSPSADDIRGAALDGLRDIARVNPRVLEETTLPMLFSRLPDRMPSLSSEGGTEAKGVVRRALGALARLCAQPDLFDMLIVRLFTKLDLTCASVYTSAEERESNVGYARGLLITVLTVLEEKVQKGHSDVPRYGVTLCPRIFSLVLSASLRAADDPAAQAPVASDDRVIRDAGRLVTLLTRSLTVDKQAELAGWLYSTFLEGKLGGGHLSMHRSEGSGSGSGSTATFEPLQSGASPSQKKTASAFAAAFVALKKEAGPPPGSLLDWLRQTLTFVLEASCAIEAEAGFTLLAATVNKYVPEPVPSDVQELLDSLWTTEVHTSEAALSSSSPAQLPSRRSRAIQAWFWIAKALVVRNSPRGQEMVEQARESLFVDPLAGRDAATALGLVAQTDDGILRKENGAVIRLLYRQKFFAYLLPRIIQGYKATAVVMPTNVGIAEGSANANPAATTQPVQSTYLIALSSILPFLPRQTTLERLPEIFPLLLLALSLPSSSARSSAARTITLSTALGRKELDEEIKAGNSTSDGMAARHAAGTAPLHLVESHTSTLVDRLLTHCCTPSPHAPPPTRIDGFRTLATLARCVGTTALRPHRAKVLAVLRGPARGVDDPKREVRRWAVDCRAVWNDVA